VIRPAGDGPAAFGRAPGLDADENNYWQTNQIFRCRTVAKFRRIILAKCKSLAI